MHTESYEKYFKNAVCQTCFADRSVKKVVRKTNTTQAPPETQLPEVTGRASPDNCLFLVHFLILQEGSEVVLDKQGSTDIKSTCRSWRMGSTNLI